MRQSFLLAVYILIVVSPARAEEPVPPDFEIPGPHIEVHVRMPDHVAKPDMLPEEARAGNETPQSDADPIEAIRKEVETVRDEIRLLQATLDLMINKIMADLHHENELLRGEIQRMHTIQEAHGVPDTLGIPRPGINILQEVIAAGSSVAPVEVDNWEDELSAEPIFDPEPFVFTEVYSWGRSPDMVAELGGNASSLKGLVGVVPRGSYRDDIEQLGRDLRAQYAHYDNVNIEVFDDERAARSFSESQTVNPAHRVLSVSKHSASGRDVILYIESGEAVEIQP